MKNLVAIALCLVVPSVIAKEDCSPAAIGIDETSSQIAKYFYTGTCHYRNEDYQLSVENWELLVPLQASTADDEETKIDVLNNLGYMKFFGFGTDQDQDTNDEVLAASNSLGTLRSRIPSMPCLRR